jgi:hypothetical protein
MTSVATDDRSVEALRGRATGVLFLSGFGALWFLLGLAASQRLSLPTACALAAGLVALVAGTVLLRRRSAALPASRLDPEEQRQAGRTFGRVNAAQWAAIVLIAVVLGRLHLDAYTPAAVTVVVGLHFFPLARLFRSPQHHVTGAALVLWGAVCLLLVPRDVLQSTSAFGTGAILWTAAAVTLVRSFRQLREVGVAGV